MKKIIDYISTHIVIVLSIVIVAILSVWFISSKITNNNIAKLNNTIESNKISIAVLTYDNKLTTVKVDSLKRITLDYKDSVITYRNKLKKLQIDYTNTYHEVYILNDSASYKYFINYISQH